MIFDKVCEIDLEIDDDSEFDVEYEPIAEFEYEYEHEHEHEHEGEYAGVDELLRGHEPKVLHALELASGMDCRAERSDGETAPAPPVLGSSRSRSATEAWTPENPGGAGAGLLKRSEGREAPQVAGREMKKPRAARRDASGHPSSLDPTGGDDV